MLRSVHCDASTSSLNANDVDINFWPYSIYTCRSKIVSTRLSQKVWVQNWGRMIPTRNYQPVTNCASVFWRTSESSWEIIYAMSQPPTFYHQCIGMLPFPVTFHSSYFVSETHFPPPSPLWKNYSSFEKELGKFKWKHQSKTMKRTTEPVGKAHLGLVAGMLSGLLLRTQWHIYCSGNLHQRKQLCHDRSQLSRHQFARVMVTRSR